MHACELKTEQVLTEEQEESNENTKVSPLMAMPIIEAHFKVSHTADLVLTRNRALQSTSLGSVRNGIAESGDSCDVMRNDVLCITSEVESLKLVDHQ